MVTGIYFVVDEDDSDRVYKVDEANTIHLASNISKLNKQDEVLAVYPETTSFYRAVITAVSH